MTLSVFARLNSKFLSVFFRAFRTERVTKGMAALQSSSSSPPASSRASPSAATSPERFGLVGSLPNHDQVPIGAGSLQISSCTFEGSKPIHRSDSGLHGFECSLRRWKFMFALVISMIRFARIQRPGLFIPRVPSKGRRFRRQAQRSQTHCTQSFLVASCHLPTYQAR